MKYKNCLAKKKTNINCHDDDDDDVRFKKNDFCRLQSERKYLNPVKTNNIRYFVYINKFRFYYT